MFPVKNKTEIKEQRRYLRLHETGAEKLLWNALRGKQLGVKFRRQHSVGKYVLDFYCSEKHIAIEVDGAVHSLSGAKQYDAGRTRFVNDHGIRVFRFTNDEIFADLDKVIEKIACLINLHASKNTPP